MWTRPACTPRPVGAGLGVGLAGIGTRGLTPTLLCREMAYGIARLAGDFILPGGCLTRPSLDTAGAVDVTSMISAITAIGNRIPPTSRARATTMASIAVRVRRAAAFIPGLVWLALAASEDSDAAGSKAVVDSMAVVADSTVAVVEDTVGKLDMTLRPVEATT